MKLTMKNNYSFQKVIGYPDDPELMSVDDVKREFSRWSETIGSWMEGDEVVLDQIAGLDGFLSALAISEVEYDEPILKYEFTADFNYYYPFEVFASSQKEADVKAVEFLQKHQTFMKDNKNFGSDIVYRDDGTQIYERQ